MTALPIRIPAENALPKCDYDVFVDLDTEGQRDLLGNSRAAPTGITPFHFNDGIDEFFGRSFRTSPRGWELVSDRDSESTVDVAPAQIQQ